jgi:hypothetical protein
MTDEKREELAKRAIALRQEGKSFSDIAADLGLKAVWQAAALVPDSGFENGPPPTAAQVAVQAELSLSVKGRPALPWRIMDVLGRLNCGNVAEVLDAMKMDELHAHLNDADISLLKRRLVALGHVVEAPYLDFRVEQARKRRIAVATKLLEREGYRVEKV